MGNNHGGGTPQMKKKTLQTLKQLRCQPSALEFYIIHEPRSLVLYSSHLQEAILGT